jgi:hypothetical protein
MNCRESGSDGRAHLAAAGSGNPHQAKSEKGEGSRFWNAIGWKFSKWVKYRLIYLLVVQCSISDIYIPRGSQVRIVAIL